MNQPPSDIIVAGHVCLDIIPQLLGPDLPLPGRLTNIGAATIATGGAVANTGLALHRLGVAVRLMGKIGDDVFGRSLLDILCRNDPKLADGMIIAGGEATSYSIVLSPPGVDRSFLHCPGANDTFSSADFNTASLGKARLLHFGYPPIMRNMFLEDGTDLKKLLSKARGAGLLTSLDMCQPDPAAEAGRINWAALLDRVLPFVDIFAPSIDELLFMIDRSTYSRIAEGEAVSEVVDVTLLRLCSHRMINAGAAVVVIKLGEYGLYLRTTESEFSLDRFCSRTGCNMTDWKNIEVISPCFEAVNIAGTTGSGDSTIAGFLAALLRGESPANAATAATAVGACSVEAADATTGITPWPQIQSRIENGWRRGHCISRPADFIVDAHGTFQRQIEIKHDA